MMTNILYYWHTIRYLKAIQIYGRIWFKIYRPSLITQSTFTLRSTSNKWITPAQRESSLIDNATFRFLNQTVSLASVGWSGEGLEKLWTYNLHYFDDLNAIGFQQRKKWHLELLNMWVSQNPPAIGIGWEPYPSSLRIVNWIKWHKDEGILPENCKKSLMVQAHWLSQRIEWHLLGNHLFSNAKALVFAGLFFQGKEADIFLKKGLRIINCQLSEQVLPDGGNFERSTMYHCIFLEDILDLINIAGEYSGVIEEKIVKIWRETANRMLKWMNGMIHPDGQIGFFNDAAIGIAPSPSELISYAKRIGIDSDILEIKSSANLPIIQFPDSGYIRLDYGEAIALLDVAKVGPDYLPGHAHADTLSFELSLYGQRVIVNGGTSCYGLGPIRQYERRTVSHSTVEVMGQSSSEVWGSFRVARRAHPFDLIVTQKQNQLSVACSHDGYTRLSGKPIHRREWLMESRSLIVKDRVIGGTPSSIARFIFHPDVKLSLIEHNELLLNLQNGNNIRVKVINGQAKLEDSKYAPEFGKVLSTKCLSVHLNDGIACTQIIWQ